MELGCVRDAALSIWQKLSSILLNIFAGLWYSAESGHVSLKGRKVLITGGSAGIGEQLAYRYASLGATVVVASRRKEVLEKVVQRCTELCPLSDVTHHAIQADLSDLESCRKVIGTAVSLLGGLDILVLNHITHTDIVPFTGCDNDLENCRRTLMVNLHSFIHLTAHALPELKASKGGIVVLNSLLGNVGHPYLAPYCASKHGLNGFFRGLQAQFKADGTPVTVTVCHLGFIGTDNSIKQLKASGSESTIKSVKPESPVETAHAIVKAANERRGHLYYPYWTIRTLFFLQCLAPSLAEKIMISTSRLVETPANRKVEE